MISKEETMDAILSKKPAYVDIGREEVLECMTAHAEQMAIGFQKWLMQIKAVYQSQTKDYYVTADVSKDDIYLTAEQLYQLYLKTL